MHHKNEYFMYLKMEKYQNAISIVIQRINDQTSVMHALAQTFEI